MDEDGYPAEHSLNAVKCFSGISACSFVQVCLFV